MVAGPGFEGHRRAKWAAHPSPAGEGRKEMAESEREGKGHSPCGEVTAKEAREEGQKRTQRGPGRSHTWKRHLGSLTICT